MLAQTNKGFDGSIKALQRTRLLRLSFAMSLRFAQPGLPLDIRMLFAAADPAWLVPAIFVVVLSGMAALILSSLSFTTQSRQESVRRSSGRTNRIELTAASLWVFERLAARLASGVSRRR